MRRVSLATPASAQKRGACDPRSPHAARSGLLQTIGAVLETRLLAHGIDTSGAPPSPYGAHLHIEEGGARASPPHATPPISTPGSIVRRSPVSTPIAADIEALIESELGVAQQRLSNILSRATLAETPPRRGTPGTGRAALS